MSSTTTAPRIRLREGRLYELMQQLDCTREELARRLGISSSSAFRIDAGRANPSTKFIAAVMALTGQPFEASFEVVADDEAAA